MYVRVCARLRKIWRRVPKAGHSVRTGIRDVQVELPGFENSPWLASSRWCGVP